jgi:hypothetical protein
MKQNSDELPDEENATPSPSPTPPPTPSTKKSSPPSSIMSTSSNIAEDEVEDGRMVEQHFFEGVEKLLEVWFTNREGVVGKHCDLRKIPRSEREHYLIRKLFILTDSFHLYCFTLFMPNFLRRN